MDILLLETPLLLMLHIVGGAGPSRRYPGAPSDDTVVPWAKVGLTTKRSGTAKVNIFRLKQMKGVFIFEFYWGVVIFFHCITLTDCSEVQKGGVPFDLESGF